MPQLFKVIDEPEPTMETPSALNRLQSMLGPEALLVEDSPAVDADIDDAGGAPDDEYRVHLKGRGTCLCHT